MARGTRIQIIHNNPSERNCYLCLILAANYLEVGLERLINAEAKACIGNDSLLVVTQEGEQSSTQRGLKRSMQMQWPYAYNRLYQQCWSETAEKACPPFLNHDCTDATEIAWSKKKMQVQRHMLTDSWLSLKG